jgi:hypothetical protein
MFYETLRITRKTLLYYYSSSAFGLFDINLCSSNFRRFFFFFFFKLYLFHMGIKLPFRYSDPNFQVFLVGFICFCCPGMFNALNGMGGAGQADPKVTNDANTALAVTFTVCSLIGAPV